GGPQTAEVPLSLFSGLNTELAPPDIPEGVSPDNQDVAFLPGSVFSRPGLHKLFASPFPGNVTVVYAKTYLQANGQPLNLFLTSDGKLWKEDVTNSAGSYSQIGTVTPGAWYISTTFGGKEYLAFSDGLHGTDVPLQFDGTFLDRVSQDGPGAAPSVADLNTSVTITSVTLAASVAITACSMAATGTGQVIITYAT